MAKSIVNALWTADEKVGKISTAIVFAEDGKGRIVNKKIKIGDYALVIAVDFGSIANYDVKIEGNVEVDKEKVAEIVKEFDSDKTLSKERAYLLASLLVIDIARKYATIAESVDSPFILAKNYIDEHISEQIKLKDLANVCYVSESYLVRIFKKQTGMSPIEFAIDKKMEKAKELLADREYRINEIAKKVGYEDEVHFSKLFKKYVGVSPKAYRER